MKTRYLNTVAVAIGCLLLIFSFYNGWVAVTQEKLASALSAIMGVAGAVVIFLIGRIYVAAEQCASRLAQLLEAYGHEPKD